MFKGAEKNWLSKKVQKTRIVYFVNLKWRDLGGYPPKDRETERQRDRETERQRDRETERQRDRETERQRDRETERQRDRKIGK
jgi:hypothetical protein